MSTAKFNQWLNSDGSENYKCRAWVNFNGTGTVAIRASGNVSSITDNGAGDYTVNFTTAMQDANYSFTYTNNEAQSRIETGFTPTTTQFRVRSINLSANGVDTAFNNAAVFR